MSLALASFLLFAQQLQATCAPEWEEVAETDAAASVRRFIQLGSQHDFEGAASFLVPGAVGANADGETMLVIDELNRAVADGDVGDEPSYVLDTMTAPGVVVTKVSNDGEIGIIAFEMAGGCITRMTYLGG